MRKWYPMALLAATIVVSMLVYPKLPDRVPTHWNLHGQIDGYGSKWLTTALMPVLLLGTWALMRLFPKIDPRRQNYAKFQDAYDLVVNSAVTLIAVIHFVIIAATLGYPVPMARVAPIAAGLLLLVIGNVLPKARPNWWFGIRTPWTLSNDRVWERTHRVGGYLVVGAGLLMLAAALLPVGVAGLAVPVIAAAVSLATMVYSYVAWRQETSR